MHFSLQYLMNGHLGHCRSLASLSHKLHLGLFLLSIGAYKVIWINGFSLSCHDLFINVKPMPRLLPVRSLYDKNTFMVPPPLMLVSPNLLIIDVLFLYTKCQGIITLLPFIPINVKWETAFITFKALNSIIIECYMAQFCIR